MKLINYKYGYVKTSDSWYNGKIIMSESEFEEVKKYLLRQNLLGESYYSGTNKQLLREDLIKRKYETKKGFIIPLRVTPIEYIVKKYKLPKYKKNNYFVEVIKTK